MTLDITLFDTQREVAVELRKAFLATPLRVFCGDIFQYPHGGAIVSAANCYGNMDGGFDLELSQYFPGLAERVRMFLEDRGGYLPIGEAQIVPTQDSKFPYIILAPTMERPSPISDQLVVRKAMYAALAETFRHNEQNASHSIDHLLIPGLGTGIGQLPPALASKEMRRGYDLYLKRQIST